MGSRLEPYNQKRDFAKTAEPVGTETQSAARLHFVVQHRLARQDHYDFRLEWNGVLLSWAVPKGPSYDTKDKRLAMKVEDHPLEYRNFEGTIPKGEYGGGTVMIWDEGYFEPLLDMEKGLSDGSLKFNLRGGRLKGKWALVRIKPKVGADDNSWLLIKERDEYAKEGFLLSDYSTSLRTGRTMQEIEAGMGFAYQEKSLPFDHANVQLANLVDKTPESDGWLIELKYDGYRILAYIEEAGVRLITRNGQDYTTRFQAIADSLLEWSAGKTMILDGEVAVLDATGKTDFGALQRYLQKPSGKKLVYIAFDILALSGEDLRKERLIERKQILETLLNNAPANIHFSHHSLGNGSELLKSACKASLEGIILKRADSIYSGTRNNDWLKMKCRPRQELVIGGFTLSTKRRIGISSLLLGVYAGGELIYAGRAGTGFTENAMRELMEKFGKIASPVSPFKNMPPQRSDETITWLKPTLVAEIEFEEWTQDNLLRHASYKGLRTDKDPSAVMREQNKVADRDSSTLEDAKVNIDDTDQKPTKNDARRTIMISGVNLSNPDKLLFEGTDMTKEAVARYYEAVAERMMPYLGNRVLSFVRCPGGVSKGCFFQKHLEQETKGMGRLQIKENSGNTADYFYIDDVSGIISSVQIGMIEFHVWGSRRDHLEQPDMLVFDLDPEEGMDLVRVREGVRDMKKVLDELSLTSFLKTSGGKGYHLVVPLEPSAGWEAVHDFARLLANAMEQRWPDRYTSNSRKAKRVGKIFIDWNRNGRGATSVAPYSLRARNGAPISMPIFWDELDTVQPNGMHMAEVLARLTEKDPWEDFYLSKQKLKSMNPNP